MAPSADYKVELVTASGEADLTVAVVGDQVVDLSGASDGDVLTVQPDGTVAPEAPGVPGAHAATHTDGGPDEVTLATSQVTGLDSALAARIQAALLDANTVVGALADDTPIAMTAAQLRTLLGIMDPLLLTVGQETQPRNGLNSGVTMSTGNLRLGFFTARKSETTTQLRVVCTTGAIGTPTLVRFGLYSVDGSGNLTLVASTANDTALLAAAQAYTKAWSASVALVAGQRYALGALVVTAGTAPQILGSNVAAGSELAVAPMFNGIVGSQADLPSPIAVGSIGASTLTPYAAILP